MLQASSWHMRTSGATSDNFGRKAYTVGRTTDLGLTPRNSHEVSHRIPELTCCVRWQRHSMDQIHTGEIVRSTAQRPFGERSEHCWTQER
jgi:hypothetical protein